MGGVGVVVVANSVCVDTLGPRRSAMVLSVQQSYAYGAFGPLLLASEEEEDSEEESEEEYEVE